MKTALDWNSVLEKFNSAEGRQQQQSFLEIQDHIESEAANLFDRLKHKDLPAAIDYAVQHGNFTVAFEICSWNLATDAFVDFRSWLKENDFSCMVAQLAPTAREHQDQDVALNIIPLTRAEAA